jgi:hypothetical protein
MNTDDDARPSNWSGVDPYSNEDEDPYEDPAIRRERIALQWCEMGNTDRLEIAARYPPRAGRHRQVGAVRHYLGTAGGPRQRSS